MGARLTHNHAEKPIVPEDETIPVKNKYPFNWQEMALIRRVEEGQPIEIASRLSHLELSAAKTILARKKVYTL